MILQGNQGQTGKQAGQNIILGVGEFSDLLVTQLQAGFYEQMVRGTIFGATWPTAALTAPSATATGPFALWNPNGSGKNLVLLKIKLAIGTFSVGVNTTDVSVVPVLNQIPTATGAGNTPRCTLIGSSNLSIANTYVSGTLVGANTTAMRIVFAPYADLAASDIPDVAADEINGSIGIAPGSGLTLCGVGGTPGNVTVAASMEWMEVPA